MDPYWYTHLSDDQRMKANKRRWAIFGGFLAFQAIAFIIALLLGAFETFAINKVVAIGFALNMILACIVAYNHAPLTEYPSREERRRRALVQQQPVEAPRFDPQKFEGRKFDGQVPPTKPARGKTVLDLGD